jgi:hypothetical protein
MLLFVTKRVAVWFQTSKRQRDRVSSTWTQSCWVTVQPVRQHITSSLDSEKVSCWVMDAASLCAHHADVISVNMHCHCLRWQHFHHLVADIPRLCNRAVPAMLTSKREESGHSVLQLPFVSFLTDVLGCQWNVEETRIMSP